jgi:hypothetical protein
MDEKDIVDKEKEEFENCKKLFGEANSQQGMNYKPQQLKLTMANCRLKADTKDTIEKKGRMTEADMKSVLNLLKGDSDCWVI